MAGMVIPHKGGGKSKFEAAEMILRMGIPTVISGYIDGFRVTTYFPATSQCLEQVKK